jgi:response regulator RpfG family c-di-GMP phosphodiesterase
MHDLLIVDDDPQTRKLCSWALTSGDLRCDEAPDGFQALEAIAARPYDLVVLDVDMPGMTGQELCQRLREQPPCPHLKIIMVSGRATPDDLSESLLSGASDYLTKPFSVVQLQARVRTALRLKDAQDHSDALNRNLRALNRELELSLSARNSDLVQARNALVLGLAELVGYRDAETGSHLMRLQRYCRYLAEEAARIPLFASQIDTNFIEMLECCAPLHDIGKAGLPDHILLKPGKLTAEERRIMQTHTTIGADLLEKVSRQHGFARAFLAMAIEIARHHHERCDGSGYPDGLVGDDIPLSARFVAIADVYDALRSRRVYKPALPHSTVVGMMVEESQGHFDPVLLQAFQRCAPRFEQTFLDLAE